MTRWLCEHLRARGRAPTVAYYATFGCDSDLIVPSWRLATGQTPGRREGQCFDGIPAVAVGCWLPELEFTYYRPSRRWSDLIAAHDRHIAVGGTPLVSYPLVAAGVPHLTWCASDSVGDRTDRVRAMPWPRRLIDRAIIMPRLQSMERRILAGHGAIYGVSRYTATVLTSDETRVGHLPVPVATDFLVPPERVPRPGLVGFAGRLADPRKNIVVLVQAVARARESGIDCRAVLVGDAPDPATRAMVGRLGLADLIRFPGEVDRTGLREFYRDLDVFVIPSHQEGLCIAGVEAMACGVPVVSTRCGGPEDFVRPDQTGFLVDPTPGAIAAGIVRIVGDRSLRARLSANARALAEREYSPATFHGRIGAAWKAVWNEDL